MGVECMPECQKHIYPQDTGEISINWVIADFNDILFTYFTQTNILRTIQTRFILLIKMKAGV